MSLKLIRTDDLDSTEIKLQPGEHIIGRGNLLNCNDKRVSREHGELLVNEDSITIKALHLNPCFFTKKGSTGVEILKLGNSIELNKGDRFGLLPNVYWYELLYKSDLDGPNDIDTEMFTEEYGIDVTETSNNTINTDPVNRDDSKLIGLNNDEALSNHNGPESPSLISNYEDDLNKEQNEPVVAQYIDKEAKATQSVVSELPLSNVAPSDMVEPKHEPKDELSNQSSCIKRSHSPDVNDIKKIKTEDVKIKPDPDGVKAGPSDQSAAANNANNGVPSINKPSILRERCMYGASCYRKNPQHRSQFSHPCDADWGPGERGICPYGVNCGKRDPRHWRDHEHPPGVLPPPQPGMQVVERRGNIFFINAQNVNFYDDHFQVEDTDGDSVDYDYEF